ncbi:hypothetical protein N7532_009771 [Penicillium argentinense]|uniref:Small nuclear ribonucleoprotein Prp3 C-terminal domain-containing protein n=1 Tax=Penicillium argentinense TaxID=1131581 RepID=A0A9W9ENJ8_9EURO|nr:uncharacterized protein N7532_009771 [Penicillium argentinense]KAJ5085000.1 hypothetical protein N7532_009771 [Penicillium argentinense]
MASQSLQFLPADLMESQISVVDLLVAMFPSPGELDISDSTAEDVERVRAWCVDPTPMAKIPANLFLTVSLPVAETGKTIQVNIAVPLQCSDPANMDQPPPLGYSLRQPDWMSKAEIRQIATSIPQGDVMEAFEYIQAEATCFLENKECHDADSEKTRSGLGPREPMVRVWFYFPSLSTRRKRDDMVNLAPGYGLTGFVLAGKPGVLCLEGASPDIDAYMSFIKTHSWGDIPSHQKKVSERFRETNGVHRVFLGMEEITDSLGERGGQRANRGDMQALEAWLEAKGLQEAFEKVIF